MDVEDARGAGLELRRQTHLQDHLIKRAGLDLRAALGDGVETMGAGGLTGRRLFTDTLRQDFIGPVDL
jgi:hypothetical protein